MRISDWSSDVCSSDLATSVATLSIGPSAMPRYSAACNGITPKTGSTMTYRAPTTEQLFVLNHIARIDAMAAHERFAAARSEEHTSELQSLMRISYAVFCLTKKNIYYTKTKNNTIVK